MQNTKAIIAASTIVTSLVLSGCKSTPAAPPQNFTQADSFVIVTPSNITDNEGTWNIDFRPFTNGSYSGQIYDYFKVDYKNEQSNLIFNACNGEKYSTESVYESCTTYTSTVKVDENDNQKTITITPVQKKESKGGFIISKSIPNVTLDKFYGYLASQKVTFSNKITSDYSSESIKGNFDRIMPRYSWSKGQADAAHRQFKDSYTYTTDQGINIVISAGFYPYRDGSIVQYTVTGISSNDGSKRNINWKAVAEAVDAKISQIVNS